MNNSILLCLFSLQAVVHYCSSSHITGKIQIDLNTEGSMHIF